MILRVFTAIQREGRLHGKDTAEGCRANCGRLLYGKLILRKRAYLLPASICKLLSAIENKPWIPPGNNTKKKKKIGLFFPSFYPFLYNGASL